MNKKIAFTFLLFLASNIFAVTTPVEIPTITKSVSAGTTFKFTETLSGKLPTGYKVKIDLNNGKGLVAMTCAATTCTLSSNVLPKGVDSASYKVGIYDAKGILQGTTTDGNYLITSPVVSSPYTKISNLGTELLDTAELGNRPSDWACTKDNKTGLIWEVKTDDNGLRDWKNEYTNSFEGGNDYGKNGNADVFVKDVNKKTLCGSSDWRLPTIDELSTLISCVNSACTYIGKPAINSKYFPNTNDSTYWSSTPDAEENYLVLNISFDTGTTYKYYKDLSISVRLVRK